MQRIYPGGYVPLVQTAPVSGTMDPMAPPITTLNTPGTPWDCTEPAHIPLRSPI